MGQTPGGSNDDTVQQDEWQRADVIQAASGDGSNAADIAQDARQHAVGGTTQLQNTLATPIGDCYSPTAPTSPNICANVAQTTDDGDNDADLSQGIDQKAQTNAVATQQQGSFAGGVDGRIHQATGPTGQNVDQAEQDKSQHMYRRGRLDADAIRPDVLLRRGQPDRRDEQRRRRSTRRRPSRRARAAPPRRPT